MSAGARGCTTPRCAGRTLVEVLTPTQRHLAQRRDSVLQSFAAVAQETGTSLALPKRFRCTHPHGSLRFSSMSDEGCVRPRSNESAVKAFADHEEVLPSASRAMTLEQYSRQGTRLVRFRHVRCSLPQRRTVRTSHSNRSDGDAKWCEYSI